MNTIFNYFKRVLNSSYWFSLRVGLIFVAVFSLAFTATLPEKYLGLADSFRQLAQNIKTHYPTGLVVEVQDGVAATNVIQPYTLTMPVPADVMQFFGRRVGVRVGDVLGSSVNGVAVLTFDEMSEKLDAYIARQYPGQDIPPIDMMTLLQGETFKFDGGSISELVTEHLAEHHAMVNLAVLTIDTRATPEDYSNYHSAWFLSREHLSHFNRDGDAETESLSQYNGTKITADVVSAMVAEYEAALNFAPETKLTFYPVALIGTLLFCIVFHLVPSFVLWGVSGILTSRISFKQATTLCLHLMVIAILIEVGLVVFSLPRNHTFLIEMLGMVALGVLIILKTDALEMEMDSSVTRLEALYACQEPALVKSVVEHNKDLMMGENGDIPLHHYTNLGEARFVQALIDAGCNLNIQNSQGETALHLAAKQGREGIVGMLIKNGANSDLATSKGTKPIHLAAVFGHGHVVEKLVEGGAIADLATAMAMGQEKEIAQFIELDPEIINKPLTGLGCYPLHCAVFKQNHKLVEFLFGHGAKADVTDDEGVTPRTYAEKIQDAALLALFDTAGT